MGSLGNVKWIDEQPIINIARHQLYAADLSKGKSNPDSSLRRNNRFLLTYEALYIISFSMDNAC